MQLATLASHQLENHTGNIRAQCAETRLAFFNRVQRDAAFGAVFRFAHFALDGGNQPVEPVFGKVIMGAGAHRGNGGFFFDHARNDDERQIESDILHQLQRRIGAEVGHAMIGQHGMPRMCKQRVARGVGTFHALIVERIAGASETTHEEQRIVLGVFNDQYA